jgi:Tfp pilus assembly protein PilF
VAIGGGREYHPVSLRVWSPVEFAVAIRTLKFSICLLAVGCVALEIPSLAQEGSGLPVSTPLSGGLIRSIAITDLDLYLKGPNGKPIEGIAVVTLTKLDGQFYKQGTAKNGYVRFNELAQSEYTVQVLAPGFARIVKQIDAHPQGETLMKVTIQLEPAAEGIDATTDMELAALNPKAQRALGKAIEALRANKPKDARNALETAARIAPQSAEVQYVYGAYELGVGDKALAKSYWIKSIELYPQHFRALISLSEQLLEENKPNEALPYLQRAMRAEPTSWRAHALTAEAHLRLGSLEECIKQAERALELGHGQAAVVQPVLAVALARKGEKSRATKTLQSYLLERPSDAEARKLLEKLQSNPASGREGVKDDSRARTIATLQAYVQEHASDAEAKKLLDRLELQTASVTDVAAEAGIEATEDASLSLDTASALPLRASWLPPDVDEKVPPVEQGASCALDDVLLKTGKQVEQFVKNVERFSATEFLKQEAIDKWGMSGATETRKFDYVVAIEEPKPGFLTVEEYRDSGGSPAEFPGGIATNGLPVLALIFHPYYAVNFEMACEGLTRWNEKLAWQIHIRQRRDKPNLIRSYRLGMEGPSYPVALRGRAWILADSYEIARLETDLIAPMPQIKLVADHTAIEYGPVRFQKRNVEMWLPQSAEVYYDWRGKRIHRRHSFSNYMLFAVDEKQQIAEPKAVN